MGVKLEIIWNVIYWSHETHDLIWLYNVLLLLLLLLHQGYNFLSFVMRSSYTDQFYHLKRFIVASRNEEGLQK